MADNTSKDMKILKVISTLEVGPVRIERSRLSAPYKIINRDGSDSFELIYRFEEDVFTPDDSSSINLGSMIAAQVAINYGLFCESIIFKGHYDRHDINFIKMMMENSAREIYVKKFLEPNPFILGTASQLKPVKKKRYLNASLMFPNVEENRISSDTEKFLKSEENQCAVLSSGGKDSLLSYGLMRDIGFKTNPVFINESGRHWYTALNAYRYFKENIPETARVWTNADRLFNWMLRHLPFVRKDYSRLRSDEYPIRLWTVAVFLFGALPILRKRGIDRLLIGDEYDTTHKNVFKGISHYDGLYDQSIHFDRFLSKYFHQKEWDVDLFSILRPLSELLIEKTLIERYPELYRHQISCHASHIDGDRIHPCGQCEKCRRIISIIKALDYDPTLCGYNKKSIQKCLSNLELRGINQEKPAIEHLAFMLKEKGLLNRSSIGGIKARENPNIMKLRFDPEKSPFESIPSDIRGFLYEILMNYSNGAVKREGRKWNEFKIPINRMIKKYFKGKTQGSAGISKGSFINKQLEKTDYLLGELSWPEAEKRFKKMDVALLPVGAIEQHGPHLPLDSDAYDAEYLAREVAKACKYPRPIVMPLISYGVSYHHEDFSGTISISPKTLSSLVYEIGMSSARHGITKLVIINGHGGNSPALHFAAQMINRDAHIFTCVDTGETSDPDILAMTETPNDVHAGEIETSTTLASRPYLVRKDRMKKFIPSFSSRYLNFTSKRSVGWYAMTSKISQSGVMGNPLKSSKEKGERMWEVMIMNLVEFVEDLKNMTLDEIYQKRY